MAYAKLAYSIDNVWVNYESSDDFKKMQINRTTNEIVFDTKIYGEDITMKGNIVDVVNKILDVAEQGGSSLLITTDKLELSVERRSDEVGIVRFRIDNKTTNKKIITYHWFGRRDIIHLFHSEPDYKPVQELTDAD